MGKKKELDLQRLGKKPKLPSGVVKFQEKKTKGGEAVNRRWQVCTIDLEVVAKCAIKPSQLTIQFSKTLHR